MRRVTASAPGKIVVSGEYAVLDGAPAISMAVDRRARVSLGPSRRAESVLVTHGYAEGSRRFRFDRQGPAWLDPLPSPHSLSLVEAVLVETGFSSPEPVEIVIDSRAFADEGSGAKYGFGSSAAVAAALSAACLAALGEAADLPSVAARAHSRHQAGRGSGVDVATSVSGGLVRYVRDQAAESIDWPPGLEASILWSGTSASTPERIAGLDAAADTTPGQALAKAARYAADAWSDGDPQRILEGMAEFVDALAGFEAHYCRGIFDAGHGTLVELARSFPNLVYKPCGAGGGDVGMAVSDAADTLAAFVSRAAASGFSALPAALDTAGATAEVDDR